MKVFRTLSAARHELPRVMPLLRDARVPLGAKIATGLAAVFIISPLNVLGDLPLLGFLDDAALLLFVAHTFVRYAEGRLAAMPDTTVYASNVREATVEPRGGARTTASGSMLSR